MIKGLFKFVFGIIAAIAITALCFGASLIIGHAVTGSWDMREWNKPAAETSAIVAVYEAE